MRLDFEIGLKVNLCGITLGLIGQSKDMCQSS